MLVPELRLLAVPLPPRHGDLVITFGIDPHKRTHTAVAIDADRRKVGVNRDGGVGALVRVDPEGDHEVSVPWWKGHGEQPEFRNEHASIELRREQARPAGTL